MIAIITALGFPKGHVPDKFFQVVAFLVNDLQIDLFGIGFEGLLTPFAFGVRMDIMTVKKTHYRQTIFSHGFDGIYGAVCTADM
jgi:hypothetical protein